MPLNLKLTPEEVAAEQWHKKHRKKSKSKRSFLDPDSDSGSRKRRRRDDTDPAGATSRKWDSSDEEAIPDEPEYGPQPDSGPSSSYSSRAHKPDYDAILAEMEEQRFREKMSMAFEDDERLDSLEAKLNSIGHIPRRWNIDGASGGGFDVEDDNFMKLDPKYLDEEDYAEWIRAGMYRRTHAQEFEEKKRKKKEKEARRAREKALKDETKRLEKAAEEERLLRKKEKEDRRNDYAREEYDLRWKEILAIRDDASLLTFSNIPWPVLSAHRRKPSSTRKSSVALEDLTAEAISSFLLSASMQSKSSKSRKEKLRETILRFHPDKFEGRLMRRVPEGEQDIVKQALGQVVRVLNDLMGEG